jgi:hypothetical protein
MQYLTNNLVNLEGYKDTEKNKPYRVQSILQLALSRFTTNKFFNNFQLLCIAGFKSAGVVEKITSVVCENEFVLDVMLATLRARSSESAVTNKNKPGRPRS